MKEKLLFVMPESLEEMLFASVVLAQYLISRMVMGRPSNEVIVVCKHKGLDDYLRACWAFAEVVPEASERQVNEADFVFEFDTSSSYQATQAVRKHLAEALAIQLGVGLMRFLPAVLVEDRPEEIGTILVAERNVMDGTDVSWNWPHREDFITRVQELGISVSFLSSAAGWDEMRAAVGRASVVVGVRGSATLIASSANRLVMELSPDDKGHSDWMRKKECATSRIIYGKIGDMTSIFVWAQIEKLMNDSNRRNPKMVEAVNV